MKCRLDRYSTSLSCLSECLFSRARSTLCSLLSYMCDVSHLIWCSCLVFSTIRKSVVYTQQTTHSAQLYWNRIYLVDVLLIQKNRNTVFSIPFDEYECWLWCLRANYVVFIVLFCYCCCCCCICDSFFNEQCLKEQQINHLLRSLKTNTNCYTYFFLLLCDFFLFLLFRA